MEDFLKEEFSVEKVLDVHSSSKGDISSGNAFQVGPTKMFIKTNPKSQADVMYRGEYESLQAIKKTGTVRVPTPFKTLTLPNEKGHAIAIEYFELSSLGRQYEEQFGCELARLHLHNIRNIEKQTSNENRICASKADNEERVEPVTQYGFHVTTCCGFVPLDNTWSSDWIEFYSRQRLQNKIELILSEENDRELMELWSELQLKVSDFFKDIVVQPSLVHGDLWSGNAGQIPDAPVMFDPGSFYAHHEFELSITDMFGGLTQSFYNAYHSLIPKSRGFEERHQLYILFHYLNHWNHFGRSYRPQTLSLMRELLMIGKT